MSSHLDTSRREEERKQQEAEPRAEKEFDPFDGFLGIESLLGHSHKAREAVYAAYVRTEFITYALRRYDDDLCRGFEDLNKIVSDIQGTCFAIFSKDAAFAKAYVLHRILRLIFCGTRTSLFLDETGKTFVKSLHMYHHVSRAMSHEVSLAEVVTIDKMLGKEPTATDRALVALRLAGSGFHYDHQFETMIKAFGEAAREKLATEFKKCKAFHDEKEKAARERYSKNRERDEQCVVHGYEFESEPEVEQPVRKRGRSRRESR